MFSTAERGISVPLVHMLAALLKHFLPRVKVRQSLICYSLAAYPAVIYNIQVNTQQLLADQLDALTVTPVVLKGFSCHA